MAEYIDRQAAIEKIRYQGIYGSGYSNEEREDDVVDMIESIPAADVRPVVTCAECVHRHDIKRHSCQGRRADFFCADGEKREES